MRKRKFKGFIIGGITVIEVHGDLPLKMSTEGRLSSPTGFNWGYGGSGAFATAHSILFHLFGKKIANKYAQQFKFDVIAKLDFGKPFELPYADVRKWLKENRND